MVLWPIRLATRMWGAHIGIRLSGPARVRLGLALTFEAQFCHRVTLVVGLDTSMTIVAGRPQGRSPQRDV